jgi:hypothetical protein
VRTTARPGLRLRASSRNIFACSTTTVNIAEMCDFEGLSVQFDADVRIMFDFENLKVNAQRWRAHDDGIDAEVR